MTQIIEHSGIINKIDNNHIQVLIVQQTACNSCEANGVCFTAENGTKIIELESSDPIFNIGDKVIIYGKKSNGLVAVLFAFVLPFILILISLFILNYFVANELISGAISVGMLLPYYFILSLFNKILKSKFKFEIRKENED